MKILRNHWYDIGGFFSIFVFLLIFLKFNSFTDYQVLMWFSLISLFFHQLEEYRIVGTFPGMINTVMYKSDIPDRYPLNTNTSFIINVFIGWGFYLLAAIFAENAVWLGIATILVSFGNVIAHTILFNLKGRTIFNAGMATSLLFFVPCIYYFIIIVQRNNLLTKSDIIFGIILGVILNFIGVLKMIDWMADKKTKYIFEQRNLLSKDRKMP